MDNKPIFSIIMPVYNVEDYLAFAVESVWKQSFEKFELILVNDCSTDLSGTICDVYAEKDRRIQVVHKVKNEGLGQARNTGLKNCSGRWIMFMDSDDWLDHSALEELNNIISHDVSADIIVYGYAQEFEKKDGSGFVPANIFPDRKDISGLKSIANAVVELDYQRCFSYAWNKIYKSELILDNHFWFSSTPLIEDFLFNIEVFKKCSRLVVLDKIYYHYRKPHHETLVSRYVSNFYELCKLKYNKEKEMLFHYGNSDQKSEEMLTIIHMKHILSAYMKECSGKSGKNLFGQYRSIKKVLMDPVTVESIAHLQTSNKKMQIIKGVIQTRNVFLNFSMAKAANFIQERMPKLWQRFL